MAGSGDTVLHNLVSEIAREGMVQLLGNSACVVAGLVEAGPGSATSATSLFPSEAKRVFAAGAAPFRLRRRG